MALRVVSIGQLVVPAVKYTVEMVSTYLGRGNRAADYYFMSKGYGGVFGIWKR